MMPAGDHSPLTIEGAGPLLTLEGMSKSFPGVRALHDVHMGVRRGEVHALLGENGAGKSTLMKILSGAYTRDSGTIRWEGQPVEIANPRDAQHLGIGTIYQELYLVPQLSISENVWMGREIFRNPRLRLIDWPEMHRRTAALLEILHADLDPRQPVEGLGVAQQQAVEIAKALSLNAKLLIMDEPTSALTTTETEHLFDVVRRLKARGVSVIFISHHLDEVREIADRGTILRDGEFIATVDIASTSEDELIRLMVGRSLEQQYPKAAVPRGEEVLRAEHITREGALDDVSLVAYAGEILGIAGLVGAGRTELVRAIFGADPIDAGRVFVDGAEVKVDSPESAIHAGMGLLPEDRKLEGLVLMLPVVQNISMASLEQLTSGFMLRLRDERQQAEQYVERLRIATPSVDQEAQYLSGGNQQKVVLAKWLASNSRVLIFDEPTRGIDVGAKVEVYNLMNELVAGGAAVIMVSSEMPELLGMSDRIMVLYEGSVTAEFTAEEATEERILAAAMGTNND
jgi:ribose transport system ATP-binding protein